MNKKAAISVLGKLIIVIVLVAILIFVFSGQIYGGVRAADVARCKNIYDYDSDGLLGNEDKCPCEYNSEGQDSGYYLLKGTPQCIIRPKGESGDDAEKYVLDTSLSSDEKSCQNGFAQLLKSGDKSITDACPATNNKNLKDGIQKTCALAVCQKASPDDKECLSMCRIPEKKCNEDLVKACNEHAEDVKIS